MKLISFFILCAFLSTGLGLHNKIAEISRALQNNCNSFIQSTERHAEIPRAFLCGQNLSRGSDRDIFVVLSLYHLLVVSGSHLSFLLEAWGFLGPQARRWALIPILAFALMTGWQAPIARALFSVLWKKTSDFFRLQLLKTQIALFAGASCLALEPEGIESSSLQLSWAATLGIMSFDLFRNSKKNSSYNLKNQLLSQTLIFAMLIPFLTGWGQLNPLGILTNLILGPTLSLILWPLSLLWIWQPHWGSQIMSILMSGLEHVAQETPEILISLKVPMMIRWIYLLTTHGILYSWEKQNRCSI